MRDRLIALQQRYQAGLVGALDGTAPDPWVLKLRDAVAAGYYRTEVAAHRQQPFPWQGKTCRDCPLWDRSVCALHTGYRSPDAHTCAYFDVVGGKAANRVVSPDS